MTASLEKGESHGDRNSQIFSEVVRTETGLFLWPLRGSSSGQKQLQRKGSGEAGGHSGEPLPEGSSSHGHHLHPQPGMLEKHLYPNQPSATPNPEAGSDPASIRTFKGTCQKCRLESFVADLPEQSG